MWDLRVYVDFCIFSMWLHFFYSDFARIIELSSAQLDRVEIANFAPVLWATLRVVLISQQPESAMGPLGFQTAVSSQSARSETDPYQP